MPRKLRVNVKGFYQIINRAKEKCDVFVDEQDIEVFLQIVNSSALIYGFKLHDYTLVINHYYLLIETFTANLSLIMRQINSKYSIYFNKKYNRKGPLWQGRFKSFYIFDTKHQNITEKRGQSLEEYFKDKRIYDSQIMDAWLDGHNQASIARYLELSTGLISRRIEKYCKKKELFTATKQKGLFWSYDKKMEYSEALDKLTIETVLKYGDFIDLKQLFTLYGKRAVKKIWKEKLIRDPRFIKLNYFLARIFFGMDVEADFFKGAMSDREKKLRMLAS